MQPRITYPRLREIFPALPDALTTLKQRILDTGLEAGLLHLLELRASQINGCGFCMELHSREARQDGERQQRLDVLPAWRALPDWFDAKERAALDWCETLTRLTGPRVTDQQFAALQQHFTEQQIAALTAAVVMINGWNRVVWALQFEPRKIV